MRAVVQRVTDADVSVDNKITGAIGKGYMVLRRETAKLTLNTWRRRLQV